MIAAKIIALGERRPTRSRGGTNVVCGRGTGGGEKRKTNSKWEYGAESILERRQKAEPKDKGAGDA